MNPFAVHHILAPTDLGEASLPALRWARLFAERFMASLTVLYADPILYGSDFAGPVGTLYTNVDPKHFDDLRAEVKAYAAPVLENFPYDIEADVGDATPSILAAARETKADLIVVGTHLRHGWKRALLGSVSDAVLRGSACPVLTVSSREPAVRLMANVVCPVNFTAAAAESLNVAADIAAAFGARLTVVHVVETQDPVVSARDEERVRRWIGPELQDRCCYREVILHGNPAERVLDCAEDLGADLLVVGAQHKLLRDVTVIGATAERLIRSAVCPVLTVPVELLPAPLFDNAELMVAGER